jgi:hypothetical protein
VSRYHKASGSLRRHALREPPPDTLYHGTFGWNADAVSREGIVPGFGPNWLESDPQYVYLSDTPEFAANWVRRVAANWARDMRDSGGDADPWDRATAAVFEVDTAAIGLVERDPSSGASSSDWRHRGAIPPSAVRLIYEG